MTGSRSLSESRLGLPKARLPAGLVDLFKAPGRGFALVILGLLVLARALEPGFFETIALRSFDREQQIAPRAYQPLPIRIVAIDGKSLSRYGQWPWPRTLVARLVRQIAAAHPRVLGVDIIFAEPDRLSPGRLVDAVPDLPAPLARELALLPANEVALAEAFKEVPTVLAVGASKGAAPAAHGPSRVTIIRESGVDPRPFLIAYPQLLRSMPELTAVARGQGSVLDNPDADGITRRVPLFVVGQEQLVPALALEMVRAALGAGTLGILTTKDGVQGGRRGRRIHTDRRARPCISLFHTIL
jgi:adenylate cyclase